MRKTLHLLAVLHVLSIVIIVNSTPSTKGFVLQELPLYGTRRTKPTAFSADDVTNKCQQENSRTEDRRNSEIVSRLMFPKSDQNRERSFNMASLMNNYRRLHNKMPMKQFDKAPYAELMDLLVDEDTIKKLAERKRKMSARRFLLGL